MKAMGFALTADALRKYTKKEKLLFAGMAGCKCVTMACNNRNTIGGVLGIVTSCKV